MSFGLPGWRAFKDRRYKYQLLPTPAQHASPSTRELHALLLPPSSDSLYIQTSHSPFSSKFEKLVDSSRSFLRSRQKRDIGAAVIALILWITGTVLAIKHFSAEAVYAREIAALKPLGDVCTTTASDDLRRVPSDDLLRWQKPWRDDLLCGSSKPIRGNGLVSLDFTSYYSFDISPSDANVGSSHPVQPVTSIPAYCLEAYFAGLPCSCAPNQPSSPLIPAQNTENSTHFNNGFGKTSLLDVFWTWVNGSDPLHATQLQSSRNKYGWTDDHGAKLFRSVHYTFTKCNYTPTSNSD